jgi:L-malate glycosyltransferase
MDLRAPLPPGVTVHRLLRPGTRWTPPAMAAFMLRLRGLAGRLRVDVIHQLNPVVTGVSLALARGGPPLVLGPFVGEWPGATPALKRAVKRGVLAAQETRADLLLLSTPAAASKLAAPRRVEHKLRVLGYGVDLERFHPSPPPEGDPRILFLGRLDAQKGIYTLLDAFARLGHPSARLRIAGAGEDAVRRRAGGLPRVELAGPVPRERVPQEMAASAVYCMPSFGEPFGLGALEAMACGRPVVGTAAGGLAHLVSADGGRLVAPGDAAALAHALDELLGDPAKRAAMGAANRRRAEAEHGWDRVAARLESYYESLIGDTDRGGRG